MTPLYCAALSVLFTLAVVGVVYVTAPLITRLARKATK